MFLPQVISPAELPPEINAFKQQQHRWTKGGAQTARKLLLKIFTSPANWKIKIEAFFHLTSCTVYIYMVLLALMLLPALYFRVNFFPDSRISRILFDTSLFVLATCSASTFYLCSQREIFHKWHDKIKYLPFLMALGIGISINNAIAAIEGFFCKGGEFVRTPKFGVDNETDTDWKDRLTKFKGFRKTALPFIELAFGLYMIATICVSIIYRAALPTIPFLVLFALGYFYVGFTSLALRFHSARTKTKRDQRVAAEIAPAFVDNEKSTW